MGHEISLDELLEIKTSKDGIHSFVSGDELFQIIRNGLIHNGTPVESLTNEAMNVGQHFLDNLHKAGYQITKKHPHKVAVAVNEDWGVKYVLDGRTNWVRDSHGFPALFSEEKAKSLCTSSVYTAQRLRLVAYELNYDTPA